MTKSEKAVEYLIDVWDEVQGNWREKPDHVQQMFLEAEKEHTNQQQISGDIKIIKSPAIIDTNSPKIIEEFFGLVNTGNNNISIARMQAPKGWKEVGQYPDFDEYIIILNGSIQAETKNGTFVIKQGEGILTKKNKWVRFSSPIEDSEYIAICIPAFSLGRVNRDKK